jgi:outer membrane protein OmpA-like peptidoglycan-associated protein
MMHLNLPRVACVATVSLIGLALLTTMAAAQSVKVGGLIKARNGETMILQTSDSPNLVVLLTDGTQVGQVQGVFKARRKEMSMAALIPGLAVKVEGTYNNQNELVAASVSFKGNDLEQAQSIQAGLHETQVKAQENKEQIAANKTAIDAAVARFGQLDDYYIRDEITVYFGNSEVKVDPKYAPQLLALTEKAQSINGYMIEVKGYASSVGSVTLNQQLSEDRANAVTNILIQQGHIPLTRMLAPGAMGESHQVGDDKTAEGQAENRRVVVRVLQNKAIAGI